ncbi:trigger factor protein [Cystoisospora suis]|uniref:Trigger factor protein n=1 Tax=Cystoisospora suis TaxID=483139 RepID=A0A2C6KCU5_9APIC|nr:trigger factor protein [Cystoisospora suis]
MVLSQPKNTAQGIWCVAPLFFASRAGGDVSYGMKAYPTGANVQRYREHRQKLVEENEKWKNLSLKFFKDPGESKRPPPLGPHSTE